jgi:E3 ubiquitin-protein ligase NRDP1
MLSQTLQGYDKDRFPDYKGESFDCGICLNVAYQPKECTKCGSVYCGPHIDDWITKKNECPMGCPDAKNNIRSIGGALAKYYRNLDIQCRYSNCKKVVKLSDLPAHEMNCQLPKCCNFEQCGNTIKLEFKDKGVCDMACYLLKKIKESKNNYDQMLVEIKQCLSTSAAASPRSNNGGGSFFGTMNNSNLLCNANALGVTQFKWDTAKCGTGIEIGPDGQAVFLKESAYVFRTVISNNPFMAGCHYWEIVADSRTENELKIGVTTKIDINLNTSFSDYEAGYCFYGLGQLRHYSNSSGPSYGKKFKNNGVLGVYLDMNKGSLSFALNGEYFGEAYKSEALKKGPIWPAVSLLHQAGFKLETGKPVPSYFL